MDGFEDFFQEETAETGHLDAQAAHFRALGYFTEKAYIRVNGVCGCGLNGCARNPHFAPKSGGDRRRLHLVIRADYALASSRVGVIDRALRYDAYVPILSHGLVTNYLFVSDPQAFPDVYPVLGPSPLRWIALPPQRSDGPHDQFAVPRWTTKPVPSAKELPKVADILGSSVIGRVEQLCDLAENPPVPLGPAISLRDLVHMAFRNLEQEASSTDLLAFAASCWIGGLTTKPDLIDLLEHTSGVFPDIVDFHDEIWEAAKDVLFTPGAIDVGEMGKLFETAGRELAEARGAQDGEQGFGQSFAGSGPESGVAADAGRGPSGGGISPKDRPGDGGRSDRFGGGEAFHGGYEIKSGSPDANEERPDALNVDCAAVSGGSEGMAGFGWAETMERQEAQIFSAALALFTKAPCGTVEGTLEDTIPEGLPIVPGEIVPGETSTVPGAGSLIEFTDEELAEFVTENESSLGSDNGQAGARQAATVPEEDGPEIGEIEEIGASPVSTPALADVGRAEDEARTSARTLEQQVAEMAKAADDFAVRIDWERAFAGTECPLQPVALVEALLVLPEVAFSDDPLCKLALLDMAVTQIPQGADSPGPFFASTWPDSESLIADFAQHLVVVQIFAALLLRYESACSTRVLAGEASLAELLTTGNAAIVSDLVADPDTVFWIQRRLLSVTTPDLTRLRLDTVSQIISAIGHGSLGDITTSYLRELTGVSSG